MEQSYKEKFENLWEKYFDKAELPIVFYYSNENTGAELVKPGSTSRCLIGALREVRQGKSLCFGTDSIGCAGGRRYVGFSETLRPDFSIFFPAESMEKSKGNAIKNLQNLLKR